MFFVYLSRFWKFRIEKSINKFARLIIIFVFEHFWSLYVLIKTQKKSLNKEKRPTSY